MDLAIDILTVIGNQRYESLDGLTCRELIARSIRALDIHAKTRGVFG